MEAKSTHAACFLGIGNALVLVVLAMVCLYMHKEVKPFQRIFYCDDESIRYPLLDGTVPFNTCIGVAVSLGIIVVIATEALHHAHAPEKVKLDRSSNSSLLTVVGRILPEKIVSPTAAIIVGLYQLIFAGLVNEVFTVVGKMGFGRQRPHFLAVCQLNETCIVGKSYTPEFCRPGSASDFKNAQKSFPSGHTSFSMVICVYLALYMQARLAFRHTMHSVKNLVQAALILAGASVAMSRVSDYRHHLIDILAGGLLGTLCAVLVASTFFRSAAPSDLDPADVA